MPSTDVNLIQINPVSYGRRSVQKATPADESFRGRDEFVSSGVVIREGKLGQLTQAQLSSLRLHQAMNRASENTTATQRR